MSQGVERLNNRAVLLTEESKFEIFGSNWSDYVWQRVVKRAAIPCITPTVNHGGDSVMVWWPFTICQIEDLHLVKGKLNQSQHTAASHDPIWNTDCWSRVCTRARE